MTVLEATQALAMLKLTPQEEELARRSLTALQDMADSLPREQGRFGCMSRHGLSLREDSVRPSLPAQELLRNAPRQKGGCFVCPAAFAEDEE